MRSFTLLVLLFCGILTGCSDKKKVSLAGEDLVEFEDFLEGFNVLPAPFQMEDTFLLRKDNDSMRISRKILTQFVPDSVVEKLTGKKTKPKFYPIGSFVVNEKYLLLKSVNASKKQALLLAFNEKNEFIAAINFLSPDAASNTREYSIFGRKAEISKHTSRRNNDGSVDEGRNVYALSAGDTEFSLILTDALDKKPTELINPIDTLSKKMKHTADYGSGKMNLFSFRDGRKSDRLNFFIHFEK